MSGTTEGTTQFRTGEHVYVEAGAAVPFQIRRIEELNVTPSGAVNAVLACFYRRSDVNPALLEFADEGLDALVCDEHLTPEQKSVLKSRELFNSNMQENIDVSFFRGKCCVLRVSDVESASSYLEKDDVFFFCYSYVPAEKTLFCDEGEIKVGPEYQVLKLPEIGKSDQKQSDLETLKWTPGRLEDSKIDDYLKKCATIGTFARTLNTCNSIQAASLLMSAASATRDTALAHALDTLHDVDYDPEKAIAAILPASGDAVICHDQLEDWSPQEAELFKEGMEKIGKDLNAIRQELLPWKSLKNLVEYYYFWKTTDGYDKSKTSKSADAKTKLVKIVLPNLDKRPNTKNNNNTMIKKCSKCSSRASVQWTTTPPFNGADICVACWEFWKKYSILKTTN